jgi:diguanylate cyclase (GGDEF)-like protein
MLNLLKNLLSVPGDDAELARAQFRAFAKQIPLLYFILAVNTLGVVYTFLPFGHRWIAAYAPGALVAVCIGRGLHWWRIGKRDIPTADAVRLMRTTNKLAFLIAVGFTAWGFELMRFGDAYAQAQVVFFLALTMIGCIFCLTHLRSAALSVAFVGVVPFSLYFFVASDGHFRAAAVNLALVAVAMLAVLLGNYRDFSTLVASRRALIDKQVETQLLSDDNLRLANQDSLTGLANRRAFVAKVGDWLNPTAVENKHVAIAFVDLDGFKNVNDDFGHLVGDRLIVKVAMILSNLLPPTAMLARLGGDEFAVLMAGDDVDARAEAFVRAALERLAQPILVGERPIAVGASIGVAAATVGECDGHELLRRADIAMYAVKANGKAGHRVYAPALDQERRRQQALEDEIRSGISNLEFDVVYQPIVDARSKVVTSVEALLRWPRRPAGPLGPDTFITAAETSGLIHPLGLFALRHACEEMRRHEEVKLSVNVSPAQFRDPDFEAKVAVILSDTGFSPGRLSLEVTESYLIDNPERAAGAIVALKAMGIAVVLDDFGAGYTSIAYLQQFAFSGIKIDRSLSSRIATDAKARVLVTGVVYLANGLDLPVTAEGVETEDQERLLRLAGCQSLQGYRFSRPKPMRELLIGLLDPTGARVA